MDIVTIKEDKYFEAVRLSEYAFQYNVPKDEVNERIEQMKKHHQVIGVVEDEKLIAKLHFLPFEVYIGEKKITMGGIAGVATYPEYRRKGLVKGMLTHILEKMKTEGYLISMLYPFSVPFYREYGWELFANRLSVSMKKSDLRFQGESLGRIKRFSDSLPISSLNQIYEQYAEGFTGMLVREEDWWEKIGKETHIAMFFNEANEPKGYMMYKVKEKKMKVEEFIALNSSARRGLWNYICQHDSMIEDLEMIVDEREPLLFSLQEPRVKMEITPYFMARLVNVEAFLKQFTWNSIDKVMVLQVKDDYAPWNNKTFLLKKGDVTVLDTREIEERKACAIHLSINTLSAILFGYKRPVELMEIGKVTGSVESIRAFEDLVPRNKPFFYDFF
ncbi:GNAT family N-acetyltransferase [Halalkalibacter alkaliphilus]|uniref:GNAT family N-acetyltransferase n=1 Tax=Halalkalibacter alkaliphilus TaxID=2917993 RepID=A0A9X2I8C4_9BACI|nr:GNAT family N-acetyltransferase [Halalkalibacter alkaliphilus]MCL7748135.1 GNAT family N-acetyltransferase [Halalkalibacter alkaliphilus]